MGDTIPTWSELFRAIPLTTTIVSVAAVGFFSAVWIKRAHIKDLKEFITYLQRRGRDRD